MYTVIIYTHFQEHTWHIQIPTLESKRVHIHLNNHPFSNKYRFTRVWSCEHLPHGLFHCAMPSNLDSFSWWCFTDSTMVNHHVSPPLGRIWFLDVHFFPSGWSRNKQIQQKKKQHPLFQARMKMQLEEMRAKLEKVGWKEGGLWQKSYFWEGRCDGLETVNSSFLGGGTSNIFVFSSGSMERWSILTCEYFSDGWFNYTN